MARIARVGLWIGVFAAVVAGVSLAASAQKASKCVMAGGEANMITEDLAKFMANAALKNSISGMGATGVGEVKMTCKTQFPTVYCLAKQKACKA
jgi:hypothetical protein